MAVTTLQAALRVRVVLEHLVVRAAQQRLPLALQQLRQAGQRHGGQVGHLGQVPLRWAVAVRHRRVRRVRHILYRITGGVRRAHHGVLDVGDRLVDVVARRARQEA